MIRPAPRRAQRVRRTLSSLRAGTVTLGAALVLLALLVGIPYGLVRWVGWPLPHHWPNSADVKAALSRPVTDRLLLDALACLCWLVWTVFVNDVRRAVPGAVREARSAGRTPRFARAATGEQPPGPLRGLASLLLVTTFSGLLSLRPHVTAGPRSSSGLPAHSDPVFIATKNNAAANTAANTRSAPSSEYTIRRNTVTVRPPRDGVHDSLWRIADRCLGSGGRWPEIFGLNRGLPQPDGGSLQLPSLIEPGWVLRLPAPPADPAPRRTSVPTAPPTPTPAPPMKPPASAAPVRPRSEPSTSPVPHSVGPTPAGASHTPPHRPSARATNPRDSAVDLGDGLYLSLGVAAAVTAALLTVRRRRRRWYQPGSGRRDDLPIAPVVRSAHLAHLRATNGDPAGSDDEPDDGTELDTGLNSPRLPIATSTLSRDQLLATASGGLGLVGSGARAAALAALLDLLSDDLPAEVLIARADLTRLLDGQLPERTPKRLHVIDHLAAALDELEQTTLHRAAHPAEDYPPTVLIANPAGDLRRLQAVLDNGAPYGLRAVLLSQWRPGTSIYLSTDGMITAANDRGRDLVGTRAFAIPPAPGMALLTLLADAETSPDRDTPAQRDETTGHVSNPRVRQAQRREFADVSAGGATSGPSGSNSAAIRGDTPRRARAAEQDSIQTADPTPTTAGPDHPAAPPAGNQRRPELLLQLFGPPRLHRTTAGNDGRANVVDLLPQLTPRQRDLLILLALHPDGLARERIADFLWPDSTGRPLNTLHNTLTRLRRRLADIAQLTAEQASQIMTVEAGRCRLEPRLVSVDYREFADAVTARRAATTDTERDQACQRIANTYRGELAEQHSADWLDIPRETARRDAVDAATRLARAHVGTNPRRALELLETARSFDPYNEPLYVDIMRIQRRLSRADGINRTIALLTARLAELNETPSPDTLSLASSLQKEVTRGRPQRRATDASAPGQCP